jgi:DNA-binding SARP family transcriptional activator
MVDPDAFRVGWIVAPAGSGKSRLLAHVAEAYPGPVVWCGIPDPAPRTQVALTGWFRDASEQARRGEAAGADIPVIASDVDTMDGVAEVFKGTGPAVLLVMDDVHLVEGSEAEAALARLIARTPPRMRLVMASRVNLNFDVSRLRVSGQIVDIGPDDLRFRTWEIEELFRDVYREPLLPEDVGALARRTAGWAAYLQLFFLATARKPQAERRRVLGSLGSRSRLVSEYLGRHVLAGLSSPLQEFLVRTSVLRRPTAALCDEFLEWESGSAELLAELERRQLFTERTDDDAYRYHAVILSYLDAKLVEELGIQAAGEEHRRAGTLLEREGWAEDALAAYAKSEDWESVARVLGHNSADGSVLGDALIEALPSAVVETDALLLMVRAHAEVYRGALADAVQTLRYAEAMAVSAAVAERCRRERDLVLCWADPDRPLDSGWVGLVRRATHRQPVEVQRQAALLPGVSGRFAEGMTSFLAGDLRTATRLLRGVANHPEATPVMAAGALLVANIAAPAVGGEQSPSDVDRLQEEVEASGVPWLRRVARAALLAAASESGRLLDDLVGACDRHGDRWGSAVISALQGVAQVGNRQPAAVKTLERAAENFGELGAGVLESTCIAYAGFAAYLTGQPEAAGRHANRARTLAAVQDSPAGMAVAALTLGALFADVRELDRAQKILGDLGMWELHAGAAGLLPPRPDEGDYRYDRDYLEGGDAGSAQEADAETETAPDATPVRLRCLGGFSLSVDGQTVDESAAKPMERALLHILAIGGGKPFHREELIEALWPEADRDAGLHRLQVAVSSLRKLLGADLVARDGDSYRLRLPERSDVDLWAFQAGMQRASAARAGGDTATEEEALVAVTDVYRGPLLPGDGPAEWVVGERSLLQSNYIETSARLAALRLQRDDPQAAAEAARSGLAVDRYRDELWKLLIEAAERAGNHAEAGQARKAYEAVLDELGV